LVIGMMMIGKIISGTWLLSVGLAVLFRHPEVTIPATKVRDIIG
jgi:hypothetical protein